MAALNQFVESHSVSILDLQAEKLKQFAPTISQAIELSIKDVNSLPPNFCAKTAPGTYLYHHVLRYTRELLKEYGFDSINVGGVELAYNKELNIGLYYCRVTEEVKSLESYPLSLRKRGKHTKQLLHLTENSLLAPDLFPETFKCVQHNDLFPLMSIWVIMLYADFKTEQYIANIGYPESVDRHSRIDSFSHRIPLSLNNTEIVTEKQPDFAKNPETEIQMKYEKLIV